MGMQFLKKIKKRKMAKLNGKGAVVFGGWY